MNDDEKLRRILNLARDAIIRLDAIRAVQYLKEIEQAVEDRKGTAIWAEHGLLSAGALAAAGNPAAEAEFEEALQRVLNLTDRDAGLEMRAYDDFAKFLAEFPHRRSRAREYNQSAWKVAVERGLREDSARLQLRITKIDLEIDGDRVGLADLQKLKQAARELGANYQIQLAAWFRHRGESHETGMLAARGSSAASVDYFKGLLISIKSDE